MWLEIERVLAGKPLVDSQLHHRVFYVVTILVEVPLCLAEVDEVSLAEAHNLLVLAVPLES